MLAGGSYSNSVHYNPLSQPNNRTYSKRIRLAAKRFFQFSWFSEDCPGDLKKLSLAGFSAYKSFKSIDYEAKKVKTCLAKPPPSTFSPLSFIKSLFNIIFLVITLALSSSSFLFCQSGIKVYFDTANSIKSPIGINTWKTGSFTLKTSDYDALRNKFRLDTFSYKQEYRFYEGEENKIPISGDFDNEKLNKWDAELDKQNKSITFRKDKDRIVIKDGENVKRYVDGEMDSSASNEYRAKIEIFPKTQGNDGYNPVGVEFLKLDSVMIVGDTIFTVGKEHYAVFSTPDSEANYVFVMASILPSYEKNYYTGEDTLFPHSVKMYEKYGREGKMRLMNSIGQTLAPETIKFLFAEREGHVHSWFKNYSDEGYKKAIAWDRIKLKKSTYDWYDMKAYVIYNKPVRFSFSVSDSLYFSISFLGVNMEQNSMRYAHPDTTFKISRGGVWSAWSSLPRTNLCMETKYTLQRCKDTPHSPGHPKHTNRNTRGLHIYELGSKRKTNSKLYKRD